jgi:hypothetical protein
MQLWSDYQSVKYSNHIIAELFNHPNPWRVESNPTTNKYREIYFVDYPYEVEIFVPPIFGIVAIPNHPVNESLLEQRLFEVIQNS